MTTKRDPWVQVKSEDELRVGPVQLRTCDHCGRREVIFLIDRHTPSSWVTRADGAYVPSSSRYAWRVSGHCQIRTRAQLGRDVEAGKVFRLADDQLADLSETRELETVR